jgi:UDP-glucose 4-epimerase
MSILVVGGSGFIGSNLVSHLIENNQNVRVLDRSVKPYIKQLPEVEYIYGDFADRQLLDNSLKGIDIVYHLVSGSNPSTSNANPVNDIETNLVTTVNFLQACVDNSVKRVIFASSGGTVYGLPKKLPVDENHSTNPICSYGINKLAIEKYLNLFHYLYGLDYCILRISNPYGYGQNPQGQVGAITLFLDKIFRQTPILIWGNGQTVRDYIYIDDVVNSFYLSQYNNTQEKILNISSGYGISLNELINKIRQVIHHDIKVNYTDSRKLDIPVNYLANDRAKKVLNWQPKTSLEDGIFMTWQWIHCFYKNNELPD